MPVRCGHVDRRAPTSPSLSWAQDAKSSPHPPPGSHSPCLDFLPSIVPHFLIIQFQVQIAQTGLGDYFFMETKHKRPRHPFLG